MLSSCVQGVAPLILKLSTSYLNFSSLQIPNMRNSVPMADFLPQISVNMLDILTKFRGHILIIILLNITSWCQKWLKSVKYFPSSYIPDRGIFKLPVSFMPCISFNL